MMTMFERMVPPSLGDFTTGPDGRFRIAVAQLPDEVRLVAYKRGLPPAESDILEPGKDHRDVTLVLRKGVEVGGTVRDTAGHPLAGVAVKALRGRRILFGGLADPLLTDSEGRFSTRVVAGSWRMTFSKDGYLPRVLPQVEVVPGIRPLSVNLDPAASIRGRVVRKDGSGVADVMIVEQMTAPAMTAADGSFALPNVSPGAHVLEYVAAGAHGEKAVTAPADDVRIVLDV